MSIIVIVFILKIIIIKDWIGCVCINRNWNVTLSNCNFSQLLSWNILFLEKKKFAYYFVRKILYENIILWQFVVYHRTVPMFVDTITSRRVQGYYICTRITGHTFQRATRAHFNSRGGNAFGLNVKKKTIHCRLNFKVTFHQNCIIKRTHLQNSNQWWRFHYYTASKSIS